MIRRTIPVLCAALLLAGCARTGAGVAARVGDERVETSTLTRVVNRGYANRAYANANPKADYQRLWLERLVDRIVAKEALRRLGLTVTEKQVDDEFARFVAESQTRERLEQAAASQGIAKEDLRDAIRDLVVRNAIADKLVADVTVTEEQLKAQYQRSLAQWDIARIAHVAVDDKKTADKVAADARKGADFGALAKEFSKDAASAPQGGDLGEVGNGSGKFEPVFMKAIFGAKTGAIVGPIKAGSGYEIVKIVERRTTPYETAKPQLRRDVLAEQRTQRADTYLADLKKELGVSVNPRFGRWDAQAGAIAPATGTGLSSPAPSPDQQGGVVLPGQPGQGQPGQGQPGQGQPGQGQPTASQPARVQQGATATAAP